MKTRLDFFRGRMDREEALGPQGQPSNLTMPRTPTHGSLEMLLLRSCERTPFPWAAVLVCQEFWSPFIGTDIPPKDIQAYKKCTKNLNKGPVSLNY